ncbi:MAG: hypothetical protein A2487_09330 [Candidatus Raymondbacteria bacterium RifOxyC12_full_50_8]|uniref:AB hydrolase-1 domain-containing protein n=1 Tax=Candidatus Raymondbacteria bacterium RIFOXYD12_FULL_49_13 TaxID=1817890 RepID=A0A1F7FI87_UNCRA|nr:MAG: hypothetical protein A2248_21395 [Candidatus Raymondbacteria bacterium RIFOXYA2_FULL_49_16]OGJ96771.1 MAG: hypothetical protein A2487_09330 [Candidatus Raymondbacteria bacterium RifOxyC12_full_50_8]OGJ98662.1 MAG: hypothetical protein A2350_14045 [Candidatus Raymondbacteria bacterium RifOxyB12_full_50_8]OGK06343.1 MAG: hypothetical protein A2519_08715 [Candidatus Raymondbacteria bacterium RIFOXYD12_FULL_49_13]OGP40677.1 MAG: hypothetical protein A2324_03465 [Candidatus Raymondbacteria b
MKIQEGKIRVNGHEVWYRRVGSTGTPLLTLHGGPGAGHDYLEPLEKLATNRPVIFYDQLGCGKSDKPNDRSLWKIERFVAEIDALRQALDLEHIHLLGHSWGGWLAIEYMSTHPTGIKSLILASTSASTSQFVSEAKRLISELPLEIHETLHRFEAASDYTNPDYIKAVREFYKRHNCRLAERPEPFQRTLVNLSKTPVYETMNGPNEFTVIGNLKNWDHTHSLGEISVPTMITVGRYDEVTPACAETLHQGIPHSQMAVFEQSSHVAHLEEPEKYLRVVGDFLDAVDATCD